MFNSLGVSWRISCTLPASDFNELVIFGAGLTDAGSAYRVAEEPSPVFLEQSPFADTYLAFIAEATLYE